MNLLQDKKWIRWVCAFGIGLATALGAMDLIPIAWASGITGALTSLGLGYKSEQGNNPPVK
jgi:hypothetical protein